MSQLSDRPRYSSQLSDRSVLQLHFTPQFYLENEKKKKNLTGKKKKKEKIHPLGIRACPRKIHEDERERVSEWGWAWERERPPALWLLFLYVVFFSLPLGLPYVNRASLEFCLFYLRSSFWSSDLPLPNFCWLFHSLSFSHCPSGLLFPILTT